MAKVAPPQKKKYIESPDQLWNYFLAYCSDAKAKPYEVEDWVGGMAMKVVRKKEKPLTLEGFNVWLFAGGIISTVHDYMGNKNGKYESYSEICSRIKEAIRADQIEGGMAGMYNPSITQRLNNLAEISNVTVSEQPLFPDK